jgi:hypothetical protein
VVSPDKLPKKDQTGLSDREEDDEYAYLLVSSAHCIRQIRNATDKGRDVSLICICEDAASFLDNKEGLPIEVESVGFHKKVIDYNQQPSQSDSSLIDIVYLKLTSKPPPSIVSDEFEIPVIVPVNDWKTYFGRQNVSGTALSGRVNGKGLQFDKDTSFLFVSCRIRRKRNQWDCHVYYWHWWGEAAGPGLLQRE